MRGYLTWRWIIRLLRSISNKLESAALTARTGSSSYVGGGRIQPDAVMAQKQTTWSYDARMWRRCCVG